MMNPAIDLFGASRGRGFLEVALRRALRRRVESSGARLGVEGGQNVCLWWPLRGFALLHEFLDQPGDGAFALGGFADFGGWGEDAQFGVGGDLFDDFDGLGFGVAVGGGFGEVEAGDLEAVEEETGAAGVDVVGGDALEDLADGVLDGGTVFGEGDFEGGAPAAAGRRVFGWCGGSSRGLLRGGMGCRSGGRR